MLESVTKCIPEKFTNIALTATTIEVGQQQQYQKQQPAGQPKPVLVIIHGESFDFGAGSSVNGQKFVQQTRLIIITFNYRLNILGKLFL